MAPGGAMLKIERAEILGFKSFCDKTGAPAG
jgi:hypothetical protein